MRGTETMVYSQQQPALRWRAITFSERTPTPNPFLANRKNPTKCILIRQFIQCFRLQHGGREEGRKGVIKGGRDGRKNEWREGGRSEGWTDIGINGHWMEGRRGGRVKGREDGGSAGGMVEREREGPREGQREGQTGEGR